jgi:hypothetical protein
MTCNFPEELLALHAGGDLSVQEAAQVEAHLASGCGRCSSELNAYRSARTALLEIRETNLESERLWGELDARLDAVEAVKRHQLPWFQRFGFVPILMTAAALLLAVVFYPDDLGGDGVGSLQPRASATVQPTNSNEPRLRPAPYQDMVHLLRFSPAFADTEKEGLNSDGDGLPISVPASQKEKIELTPPSKKKEI